MPVKDGSRIWGGMIRQIREEQGVSQRTLARKAKVNRSTLRRLEDGEARGDIDVIERLLNAMGYELDAFAAGTERHPVEEPKVGPTPEPIQSAVQRLLTPLHSYGAAL